METQKVAEGGDAVEIGARYAEECCVALHSDTERVLR